MNFKVRKMKKILKSITIAIILCLATLLITACGDDNKKNQDEDNLNIVVNNNSIDESESSEEPENNVNLDNSLENDTSNEQEQNEQVGGYWEGNTYINEALNIEVVLPDGRTDYMKEMQTLMKQFSDQISEDSMTYELIVINENMDSNIAIVSNVKSEATTEKEFLEQVIEDLKTSESMQYTISEQYTINLGKNQYSAVNIESDYFGLKQLYCVTKQNESFTTIVITSGTNEKVNEIKEFFK